MRFYAKARRKPGEMNKTEKAYSDLLEARRISGEIFGWYYEAITLKIAKDCRYTPDFMVVTASLEVEFHEVKGYWIDDAKVKIKVASSKFPFRFIAVSLKRKEWVVEEF